LDVQLLLTSVENDGSVGSILGVTNLEAAISDECVPKYLLLSVLSAIRIIAAFFFLIALMRKRFSERRYDGARIK
jgi:hypothetical protein